MILFIRTIIFFLILEKHLNKNQYLEAVFFELYKSFNNNQFDEKLHLDLDKAVIKGHPDTNVYLLFLVFSVHYISHFKHVEKVKSLSLIIESTMNENLPSVIKSVCIQIMSQVKLSEGKIKEGKLLMLQSIAVVDKKYPRYCGLLLNFAQSLAVDGLILELNKSDIDYINLPSTFEKYPHLITRLKLRNCMAIGDYKQGFNLIDEHQKRQISDMTNQIEGAKKILKILSGDLDETSYKTESYRVFVRVLNCILSLKLEEASIQLELLKQNTDEEFNVFKPDEYIPLHLELCKGNKGKVRLLLKEKENQGMSHYMDDLFHGRLQLLEKDEKGANQSFSDLIKNVNRYGAMNRLVFELQFAKEMKLSEILFLTQGWKQEKKYFYPQSKKEKTYAPKFEDKCVSLLVGSSLVIVNVKDQVKKYASLKAPVLVTGETGTGKELVSRAIHDEGPNPHEPFLAINCGALTESLLQSELFGYVAGAFTGAQKERKGIFEAAGKGTVFLDEFGDISPQLQVSLLRVLEANEIRMIGDTVTRKIECRIVIATNIDLHKVVEEKKFREDLYFRLARFEIRLPALRERIEDLQELIQFFLDKNRESVSESKTISNELLITLSQYHWPGNIRELKNEIERLYILNPDTKILGVSEFDFGHLQASVSKNTNEKPIKKGEVELKEAFDQRDELALLKLIKEKGFQIEQRLELLKESFKKHKKLTRNQTMVISQVSASTATKDLQLLCKEGFIVRRSPTKSPRSDYFELVN